MLHSSQLSCIIQPTKRNSWLWSVPRKNGGLTFLLSLSLSLPTAALRRTSPIRRTFHGNEPDSKRFSPSMNAKSTTSQMRTTVWLTHHHGSQTPLMMYLSHQLWQCFLLRQTLPCCGQSLTDTSWTFSAPKSLAPPNQLMRLPSLTAYFTLGPFCDLTGGHTPWISFSTGPWFPWTFWIQKIVCGALELPLMAKHAKGFVWGYILPCVDCQYDQGRTVKLTSLPHLLPILTGEVTL